MSALQRLITWRRWRTRAIRAEARVQELERQVRWLLTRAKWDAEQVRIHVGLLAAVESRLAEQVGRVQDGARIERPTRGINGQSQA